jgi:hypothetical protein
VTCILTRLYEEYDYQRKLVETQAKIELALCGKEIESIFGKMQLLSVAHAAGTSGLTQAAYDAQQNEYSVLLEGIKRPDGSIEVEGKLQAFERYKKDLRSQVFLSHSSAALAGLKNGLAANSAIGGLLFAVATILALSSMSVPPLFVLACGIAGMTLLIGFLIHSLRANYKHLKANPPANDPSLEKVNAKLVAIKESLLTVSQLKPTDIAILDGNFDPSPQFFFQEWFEVVRSFLSGMAKGQKSVDYTLNPLLETNDKGHWQDSRLTLWFTIFTAGVYAIVLALRAGARGFGRPGIISTDEDTTTPPSPQPAAEPPIPVRPAGGPPREGEQPESEVVAPIAMPTPAGVGGLQPSPPPIPAGNGISSSLPHSSLGTTQVPTAFSRPTSSEGRAHLVSGLRVDGSPALTASSEEEDDMVPPLHLDEKVGAVEDLPRARTSSGEMTTLAPVGRFTLFHHPSDRSSSAIPRVASASILPERVAAATRAVSMGCLPLASPGDTTPGLE